MLMMPLEYWICEAGRLVSRPREGFFDSPLHGFARNDRGHSSTFTGRVRGGLPRSGRDTRRRRFVRLALRRRRKIGALPDSLLALRKRAPRRVGRGRWWA